MTITGGTPEQQAAIREALTWCPPLKRELTSVTLGNWNTSGYSTISVLGFLQGVDLQLIVLHEYGHVWDAQWLTWADQHRVLTTIGRDAWRDRSLGYNAAPDEQWAGAFARHVGAGHIDVASQLAYGDNIPLSLVAELVAQYALEPEPESEAGLQIITRTEWGARPPKRTLHPTVATETYLHHSVGSGSRDWNSDGDLGDDYMREMQRFHQDIRGWSDIAYNHAIDPDGLEVYEGRGWGMTPGAQAGHNIGTWAVVIMGDFRIRHPSPALRARIAELVRHGIELGHLPSVPTLGHKDAPGASTSCPGGLLYAYLPEINDPIGDDMTPEEREALHEWMAVRSEYGRLDPPTSASWAKTLIEAHRAGGGPDVAAAIEVHARNPDAHHA